MRRARRALKKATAGLLSVLVFAAVSGLPLLLPSIAFASPSSPTFTGGADASGNVKVDLDNLTFNKIFVSGNYAYVVTAGSATACVGSTAGTSAIGCELQVYDISTPSSPTYVGGADASGSTNSGTDTLGFNNVYVLGNYAYVVAASNPTACSQTAGSAIGCEFQVYDISTPSSPTYVGGADSSGSTNSGTGTIAFSSVYVSGNYAYVTNGADPTACSQSAGSAIGCELQVYLISTPSTPTYQGGADASGSTNSGTGSSAFNYVYVSGNYAYVAKAASATACSQSAGSAIGCELQVYDISTPSTPTYQGGADASGSTNAGAGSGAFNSVYVSGNYAYVAKAASATACSQTAGSAIGCELQAYLISTPSTPAYQGGADASGSTNAGAGSGAFNSVYVSGNYAYVAKAASATACSQSAGSAIGCELQVYLISTPSTPTYQGGADASGSTNSGTGNLAANGVFVSGANAYLTKAGSATNCLTDKTGCELLVLSVSTPSTPTVSAGMDVSGNVKVDLSSSAFNKVFVSGNYAYVVTAANGTACVGSTAGTSAIGCELQIYDISTPSSPTYVGGADSSGSTNSGTGSGIFNSVYVSGNYAYVVKNANTVICSQTAGSAIGCELQVFDISTPSSPTYVGGADASGSTNAGAGSGAFNSVYVSGNYAYVAKANVSTACSQTAGSAVGCELQVYDISTPSSPTYVGGADSSGSTNSGTGTIAFNSVYVSGNYAYIAKAGNATACSQSAGSAIGCELQVYDISTPSTPTYQGGADASGSTNSGTGSSAFNYVYVSGNYAYIANSASATACSQSAGSAIGCELQVYLISTPSTPAYQGGADASGSTNSGTGSSAFNYVYVSGNYAYIANSASATACSQSAGSAIGCELQVYLISTPSTPTYQGGADASGTTNSGTGSLQANGVFVSGNYAYVTKNGNATSCLTSDKTGCELQIYDITAAASAGAARPPISKFWRGFFRFVGGSIRIR